MYSIYNQINTCSLGSCLFIDDGLDCPHESRVHGLTSVTTAYRGCWLRLLSVSWRWRSQHTSMRWTSTSKLTIRN